MPLCVLCAGAVLTHANLIADAAGTCVLLDEWEPGDRHIRYNGQLLSCCFTDSNEARPTAVLLTYQEH
jgi:hypothetical protein